MKNPRKLFAVAVPRSIVWVEADSIEDAIERADASFSALDCYARFKASENPAYRRDFLPALDLLAQIEPEAPDAAEIEALRD